MKRSDDRDWATCEPCGKRAYDERKTARRVKRGRFVERGLRVYRCPAGNGYHVGHIPPDIRHGLVTRGDLYPRAAGAVAAAGPETYLEPR